MAKECVGAIAEHKVRQLQEEVARVQFVSFLMDGSQDISGKEQETLYLCYSHKGKVSLRFLTIDSPTSAASQHLFDLVQSAFKEYDIDLGI